MNNFRCHMAGHGGAWSEIGSGLLKNSQSKSEVNTLSHSENFSYIGLTSSEVKKNQTDAIN